MKNKIFYPLLLLSVVVVTFSYNAINSIPFAKKVVDLLHSEQQDSVKTSTLAVVKTDTLKSTVSSKTPAKSKTYRADIHQGIIGTSTASEQDDAYDNVFHIRLDALPQANESAYLEYDLYGFDSPASIGRSLNNQTSIGGQFLSYNNTWTKQSELLDSNVLQKGNNVLLFTALKDPSHRYKIRNVRITYQVMAKEQTFVLYRTDHKFYIRGVCRASELKKLNIAGIQIDLSQPDFELILDKKELKDELIVTKELASGKVVVEKIGLKSFKKADAFVANDKAAKAVIKRLNPMQETRITNGLFTALFPKGALDKAIDISCTTLRGIDLAPLNSGMVNVTHRVSGYRLLPHGTVFNEEVNLGMAYDPDLIPEGYTTADVQVFYFDESARLWQAIPKESIDVVHGLIQAKTTHFTDFIAGIIQLPESPETSGNVPTSIKGLQAAHPLTGIGSIAAPSANNRGTASMGYAVEIPQGRGGMQPQVQIGYSSEQGHSWLGTGWDVALPSIGIETRWGTPRYDASYETESYVYAGESLLPDAHRSDWKARSTDKRFFPRSENSFQQIERKGSSPQTYYWIVKDKSGITSYYGANASGLSQNAVLQDAKGNIGHWALCYQVDLKGNSISYEYDKIEGELYIKKIYYTGSKSEKGNYSVTFLKNSDLGESNRKDIQVNARLGFKQVRNQLLRKIEVKYKDELIRGYELTYKEGAFSKTLLETISTLDSNGKLFYTNKLDYYDDVRDSNGIYTPFGPEIAWDVPNDNLKNRNIPPFTDQLFDADHTIVSSSEGDSKGVNYRLGVGLATNSGSLKGFTVGGHGGNSWGSSTTITTMIDIDGDGLADKVYKNGKKVYYRKNLLSEGKMGFGEARELNISDIGTSKSTSFNWGVDLNLKYGNIGYNEERSVNTTRVYFMDFNNDGLVDLVSNGVVYYNRLENGIPTFRNTSAGTPSPVAGGGNITIPGTSNIPLEEIESQNPLHDIVRVWVAPVKGIISVNHQFNLVEETDPEKINERKEYVTDKGIDKADGVRLFFQKDNQVLWKQAIGATDYSSKTKVDTKLAIEKGEKLYFRVSSIYDGNYDLVHWDPTITYEEIVTYEKGISKPIEKKETIAATAKDVNGYSLTTYRASKDFFTSSYRGVVVPVAGKVSFEGVLSKPITSDHVSLVITKQSLVNPNLPVVIVFEKQFLANEIVSFDLGTINLAAFEANSFVKVYLKTDSTIAWDSISFTPKIIVPSASTGTESIAIEVNHNLYGKRSGNYINKGITAPIKGKVNLDILEVDRELSTAKDSKYNGKVTLLAKQNNTLVGKKVYQLKAGKLEEEAVDNPTGIVYAQAQANEPIALEMVVENEKSLDLIRNYPTDKALPVQVHVVEVKEPEDTTPVARWNGDTTVFDIYTVLRADEIDLGVQHRGWGGFLINGNLAKEAIDQTRLVQPKSENSGIDLNDPNLENTNPDSLENTGMELSKAYFIGLTKQYSTATWRGLEEDIFIASSKMQASRLGENDLSVYTDFSLNEDTQAGGTTAMNIINENKSKSFALGGGASVGGASFGGGISKSIDGESFVTQAMGDFNGDGYPDYVRGKSVQVTLPVGKVSPTVIGLDQRFSHSSTESMGGSLGGSYSHGGTAKSLFSDVTPEYTSKKNPSKDAEKAGQSVSLSGNVGKGSDYATAVYMDINGDGLPDQVLKSGKVRLNTGYGFLEEFDWHFDGLTSAKSSDWSAGMGYSVMNGSISGGMNYGRSESDSTTFFIDINGDGLVDRLNFSANNLYVEHNLGDRYDSPIVYPYSSSMNKNRSVSYGANTNVTVEFSVFLVRFAISVGGSLGWSTAKSEGCFLDIDGDGNLDYVVSKKDGHLVVKLSTIRRTNKLKSVHNAAGNSFEVDYEYIKPSYDRPSGVWALKSVDVFDGHKGDGIDHSIQKYAYENGYYNRREREFYGFGKVTSQQIDASDDSVFSTVVSTYHNKDYFRKGLLAEQVSFDKEGIKRAETTNAYSVFEAGTTQLVDVKELYSSASDSKGLFVGLVGVNQKTYEQDQSFLSTTLAYGYDRYGNIVSYSNSGNGTATDVVTAKIRYAESANPYFGAKATQIEVTTTDGLVRKREAVIDAKTAEVTQIKNYSSAQQVSITDLVYDNYGNLSKLTGPSNYRNQRMSLSYSYDSENNQYLTQIKDGFGYQNTTVYDYRFGVPVSSIDRNDQRTVYAYDAKGRLSSLTGPYELAANKPYTIAYEYHPEATVPYAKTRNYDPAHQADIETYTYSDGLGRAIQVKKTGSLFTQKGSADQLVLLVSGKTVYDGLGRVIQTYEPTSTTVLDNTFSTAVSDVKPTEVTYDAVSRPVKVVLPDGSTQSTSFAIGRYGDVSVLMTKQTDALNNTREVYTDSKGLTVLNKHNDLETKFVYNALGENLSVIDAQDKASKSSYNWLGQRMSYTHPDAGTTTYTYDLAGNLTHRVTQAIQDLFGKEGAITYSYDYNRLSGIDYPKNPQNNVRYHYGEANSTPSRRGRLWYVQDGSGGQEFFYGKLGEVEKEIRTLRISPTDIQTYITQYQYDTWNRMQQMVYPDGEEVTYTYNKAGDLQAVEGVKEGHSYAYIKQLGYDQYGQRQYVKYGNDTETTYRYDPLMHRLQQMSLNSGIREVMNNRYSYDLVGNITSVQNNAAIVNNSLGGSSLQEYTYDSYYRLATAKGSYKGEFVEANYQLGMRYNTVHGITQKELLHTVNQQQKGYVLNYGYQDEAHPHAVSSIEEVGKPEARGYVYDGNGNPLSYSESENFRKFSWDEENRLMGINDNGELHQYTYDHSGERILKSKSNLQQVSVNGQASASLTHSEGYIGYVNPYFVISKGKFTKHYFDGASRVVSKLGNGVFRQPIGITAGGVNYTKLTEAQQKALDEYIRKLGIPPGPPTQQGIYGTPEYTGMPYPSLPLEDVKQNQEPPQGWPRNPRFNEKGDVPGPPAQFGPPVSPEKVKAGEGFVGTGLPEQNIYYLHSDHLGSTSYITAQNGSISQHVEYMAFGEVLYEEHSSSFVSPYLYNGKELDRETGLYYYGARYYDPKVSVFLNVDPLAEQTMEPYSYVGNNPVMFVDPTGMSKEDGIPPGEVEAKKGTTIFLRGGENGKGVQVLAPDGKYHTFNSKIKKYSYSDGQIHNEQQKKEGVWSFINKEGSFLWHNVKGEYVLNTSDRGAGENEFPSIGKMGTTYAGGYNPRSIDGTIDDYSQPPQNMADYMAYIHDKEYDIAGLKGINGVLSHLSTSANNRLIYLSKQVITMYRQRKIDPFTGAPVSKLTHDTAINMVRAFQLIESVKQKE